jgi:hypothetical protein
MEPRKQAGHMTCTRPQAARQISLATRASSTHDSTTTSEPEIVPPYWFQPYQRNRSKPVRYGILRLGQAHAAGRVRGNLLPARRVGVPRTWKGFGHEKSSVSASDRCHHRYHCIGDTITSSGVAGRLGCRSRTRSNCWYGDRWNSGRRPRPWPRLLLLPRTERRLSSGCILRPLVLYVRSVIVRCDAEVRTTKVAERGLRSK